MKRVYTYILIIPLILLFGCQKDTSIRGNDSNTTILLSLYGSSDGEATKTSLAEPREDFVNFLWKSGDNLGLYIVNNGNVTSWGENIVSILNREAGRGAGHREGSFSTKLTSIQPSQNYSLKLYYPHYEFAGNGTTSIFHRIYSVQTQSEGSNSEHLGLSGDFGYATAAFSTPSDLSDYSPEIFFTLEHKSSYIVLNITSEEEALYSDWIIKQITLNAPSGRYLSGKTIYDITNDSYSIDQSSNQKYEFVSLKIPGGISISSTTPSSAYFVVAPTELAGETIQINYLLEKRDGSSSKYIKHSRTISASSTAFQSGVTHVFNEKLPSAGNSSWSFLDPSESTALDESGYSNSYIVSTPGSYSFSATTIGNGVEGLLGLPSSTTQFHTEDVTINPVSAELIWQTSPALIENVSLSDGRVYFTKGLGTKGNALIAVKDGDGVILWSWHIWCTDSPKPQTYINDVGYSFEVMDRNLGATIALDRMPESVDEENGSIGLLYQWGRKDPITGAKELTTTSALTTVYSSDGTPYVWPAAQLTSPEVGTIQNSIKNPTLFISSLSATPYDWFQGKGSGGGVNVRGFYLWGNPYGFWHGTEGGSSPNNPRTPRKAIYDPCPVGWMVAPRNTFTGLTTGNSTHLPSKGRLVYYQNASTVGPASWFPYAGRRNVDGSFMQSSTNSWVWTSGFRHQTTYAVTLFSMNSTTVTPANNYYTVWGSSVRCVQQL